MRSVLRNVLMFAIAAVTAINALPGKAAACACQVGDNFCSGDCCYPSNTSCLCVDRGVGSCS